MSEKLDQLIDAIPDSTRDRYAPLNSDKSLYTEEIMEEYMKYVIQWVNKQLIEDFGGPRVACLPSAILPLVDSGCDVARIFGAGAHGRQNKLHNVS